MAELDAKFYTNSGIDKTNKGDMTGALEDFNKSLELKPDWALTYFSKASCFVTPSCRYPVRTASATRLPPQPPLIYAVRRPMI